MIIAGHTSSHVLNAVLTIECLIVIGLIIGVWHIAWRDVQPRKTLRLAGVTAIGMVATLLAVSLDHPALWQTLLALTAVTLHMASLLALLHWYRHHHPRHPGKDA